MGERIRSGENHRRLAAGACALALAIPAGEVLAQRAPPARESGGKGGAIVRYEEKPSSNILYLEESGGMVTQVTRPVPREPGEEPVAASAAPAKATLADTKAKADAAARRGGRRSALVPEAAGTRP